MLLEAECVPCIQRMSAAVLRKLQLDENTARKLSAEILEIPALRGFSWNITSAEVIEEVWGLIVSKTGNPDPFRSAKSNQNKRILDRYPVLQQLVNQSSDPLYTAVKLAIWGNSIDLMVPDTSENFENAIKGAVEAALSREIFLTFEQQLLASRRLVYFGDNAGEIVLDKLLIETIKGLQPAEVVYVVRSVPTLNDATQTDAFAIGLDDIAQVIGNGIEGPLPGTL